MKILILTDYFTSKAFGGAGIVNLEIVRALIKKGYDIYVITTSTDKSEVGENTYEGIKVYTLYSDYKYNLRAYLSIYNPQVVGKIRKLIKNIQPDIVQAYSVHTYISYYSLKLAKNSGAKVFITMHDVMAFHQGKFTEYININDISIPRNVNYKISQWQLFKTFKKRYNPFRNILIRHYLKYADKIFAVSHALKQALNDNKINNVEVIHNGINIREWIESDKEKINFKNKYNLNNKKVVSFAGWVNGAKGGDQLLLSMKKVIDKIPDAVLLAVGRTDIYYCNMKESAKNLGILDKIIFTGWLTGIDLKASFICSDVVVFPSVCLDTFGMVNLQAMVSKKPVIATCFGGASEIVEDGKCGYIVNPYNTNYMAARIIELLDDATKAKIFGEYGYERAVKYFNLDDKVEQMLKWYIK